MADEDTKWTTQDDMDEDDPMMEDDEYEAGVPFGLSEHSQNSPFAPRESQLKEEIMRALGRNWSDSATEPSERLQVEKVTVHQNFFNTFEDDFDDEDLA